MSFEFKFPDVGEGIHEGEIVRWRIKVGDEIKEDQPLVEMETAKAIVEIPSPRSGVVLALFGKEGEIINVGAVLTIIGEKGESLEKAAEEKIHIGEVNIAASAKSPGVVGQIPTEETVSLPPRQEILPRVRKLAQKLGVDISTIKGTGPANRITEEDIKESRKKTEQTKVQKFGFVGDVEVIPLKGVRKVIADHMVMSKSSIPHVTHYDEADATNLIKLRNDKKAEAEKSNIKLTFLPFIIKCAIDALKKHPALNATLESDEIICKKYYNTGIAVDTPEGLMLPVIKNADQKDVFEIAKELSELAEKCRSRTIHLDELQNGTFSITNIGSIGGIMATPVITYGQTAILGVFKIKEKPVAENSQVIIKSMLSLTITYDHRVVDGAEAARFMNDLIALIQNIK